MDIVGLRPVTSDTMPVLGSVPGIEHIWLATGHGPTGLTLGPYSGKMIAAAALGQAVSTDISAFHITRFAAGQSWRPVITRLPPW